jgi:hypothetical protein
MFDCCVHCVIRCKTDPITRLVAVDQQSITHVFLLRQYGVFVGTRTYLLDDQFRLVPSEDSFPSTHFMPWWLVIYLEVEIKVLPCYF